jgi:hypothetical protein
MHVEEVRMRSISSYGNKPIHTRSISVATYPADEHAIIVEGRLKDERLQEIISITSQEKIPPGVVHEIVLRLLVRGPKLTIEDLEVEYVHMPREACHETVNCLRPLIGRTISPGFTSYAKSTFGGPRGCTHLNALLIAMAPAAVQGFWNHAVARKMQPAEAAQVMDKHLLIDSCWVWRSDGPLVEELGRILSAQGTRAGKGTPEGPDSMEGQ